MARGGWSNPLSDFITEVEKEVSERVNEISLFALQQLILHSPVDTGAYRGSHFLTVDDEDRQRVPERGEDEALREAESILASTANQPFKRVVIQTNIIYGQRIEDGWSGQAPHGVYAIAANSTRERYGR